MLKLSIESATLKEIESMSIGQLETIFSSEELEYSKKISLAGKLSAKRAFAKAASIGMSEAIFYRIVVKKRKNGRPYIFCADKKIAAKLKGIRASLSISHTKDTAVSVYLLHG